MRFQKLSAKISGGKYLRITFLAGLILLVFAGCILTVFWLFERGSSKTARRQDSFFRILREYDISAETVVGTEKEFEGLNRELDRLEKRAISVESWLSVLKRRKALANLHRPSMGAYRSSINRALKAYPLSQPIAAVAAAALVKDTALDRQAEEKLRGWLPLLTDPSFNTLRLGFYVLLGDFRNPQNAAQLPDGLFSGGSEDVTVDLAILKILRADIRGAAADIQAHLNSRISPSNDFLRFAAEYYYDFGDLSRSAELFSLLEGDLSLLRQADALYLAGFTGSARSIWSILADSLNENSLYNLAVTSEDQNEAAGFLEKLANTDPSLQYQDSRQFGIIRYSRLLDYSRAIAVLEDAEKLEPSGYPYIDLEICRRYAQRQEPGRQIAEAWLLLERHPENENLYWWAAWQIFFNRYYDETKILLNHAERLGLSGQWVSEYMAVQLMLEGDLETAESILRSIPGETAGWNIYANRGCILETQSYPARALEQYELAALKLQNPKTASRIQFRIAKCFFALGRVSDAYRALEYALDIDPENHTARLELDRAFLGK